MDFFLCFSAEFRIQVQLSVQLLWKQRSPCHCSVLQGKRMFHRQAVVMCPDPTETQIIQNPSVLPILFISVNYNQTVKISF